MQVFGREVEYNFLSMKLQKNNHYSYRIQNTNICSMFLFSYMHKSPFETLASLLDLP